MADTKTIDRVATARRFVEQVFNGANAELARDYFADDIIWHGGALGTVNGVDTIVPILGGFIGALDDIHAEVQDVIATDDLVALRLLVTAVHTGNLLGVRPAAIGCSGMPSISIGSLKTGRSVSNGLSRIWPRF